MDSVKLKNGVQMPLVGLGTWQVTDREAMKALLEAGFSQGYRLIDTAAAYSNEIAVSRAIRELGLPREELFLSDKVWNTSRGFEPVQEACKRSLKKLKTDYLDLYLIHWPASPRLHPDWEVLNADTWRGMEQLYKEGLVRAIGVCNFKPHHLEALGRTAEVFPMVNQFECHPGLPQQELLSWCRQKGVHPEASSPLGNGQVLQRQELRDLGARYGKSPAQICLRWALQKGITVIPKTGNPERLSENRDIFGFSLEEAEMALIDAIPYCGGLGLDPDEVTEFG